MVITNLITITAYKYYISFIHNKYILSRSG
jgi:hypothetical protein